MSKVQCDFIDHTFLNCFTGWGRNASSRFCLVYFFWLLFSDRLLSLVLPGSHRFPSVLFSPAAGLFNQLLPTRGLRLKKRGHVPVPGFAGSIPLSSAWGLVVLLCLTSQSSFVLETIVKACFFLPG